MQWKHILVACVAGIVLAKINVCGGKAVAAYNPEPAIRAADSASVDAFGRWRVSNETPQIHIQQYYNKSPLTISEATVNTGAVAFQANQSSSLLTTAASGDVAIQQSYQRSQYQAGQSQIFKMTSAKFQLEANVTKRQGLYDCTTVSPYITACDGLWLSSEGGDTYYANAYNSGTATTRVARANWDDPLDGTGPSKLTVDFEASQILVVDYQWLGVGRVRWFVFVNGVAVKFLEMNHAGTVDYPYMASPNHPLRWEISQSGAGSGTFRSICGETSTEGSIEFVGTTRGASNGTTEISMVADTSYAMLGVKTQSAKDEHSVILGRVNVTAITVNDDFEWRICLNPTVAGTFTYSNVTNSPASVAIGTASNTVSDCTNTDGKIVAIGYGSTNTPVDLVTALRRPLGHSVDGVYDAAVVVIRPFANADAAVSLTWEERH